MLNPAFCTGKGDKMNNCIFEMPSYTYAVKGEKLLKSRGYACMVRRKENSGTQGCGFTLNVGADCRSAAEILDKYSVPYTLSMSGGE